MTAIFVTMALFVLGTVADLQSPTDEVDTTTVLIPPSATNFNEVHDDSNEYEEDGEEVDGSAIFQNPQTSPEVCHNGHDPAWLCNSDRVLAEEDVKKLEMSLASLYHAGNACPCSELNCSYTGLPMVVIVQETNRFSSVQSVSDRNRKVTEEAQRSLKDWDFDTCQDGAITVVIVNESLVITAIGETSQKTIPADCQAQVENAASGLVKQGRVYEGLQMLIEQYRSIVLKQHACSRNEDSFKLRVLIPIILMLVGIIVCAVIAAIFLVMRRRESRDIKTEVDVPLKEQQPEQQQQEQQQQEKV